jgi:hypothetical protein
MLAVSLDCPFVLYTLCWQFLWIVPSSCVPYVGSFSGLSLRLVYPMLAVSLDCPFVLCTLCWQFLWIVPSPCVPHVGSFSGLSLRLVYPMLAVSLDCPFVLCILCCQFLWIVPSLFSNVYFYFIVLIYMKHWQYIAPFALNNNHSSWNLSMPNTLDQGLCLEETGIKNKR